MNWLFGSKTKVDYNELLNKGAKIVDVRSPEEFKQGHIKGSVNIPLQVIGARMSEIKDWNKPIIACCLSGGRSAMATKNMNSIGIEAYNGGGWQALKGQIS